MRTREREVVVEGSQSKEALIQHSEALGHLSGRVWPESKPYVWPNLLRSTRDGYACVLQDYDLEIQKLCQAWNTGCPAQTQQFAILNWLSCTEMSAGRKGEEGTWQTGHSDS